MTANPTPVPRPRLAVIDAARAAALFAMACFHTVWDLGALHLTPENYAGTPIGRAAAQGIAGSFLVLVGVGLVLMNGRGIQPGPTIRRLARIAAGALLVTVATRIVFPDAYVFFGILHCIAVASLIGLPFLFVPWPVTLLAATAILAAPHWVQADWLDAPSLWFLGLGRVTPRTNDYVPLMPWFGLVLIGIVVGRLGLPLLANSRLGAWTPRSSLARLATFAGRHSLAVYLIHQPVLFGLVFLVAQITGPHPQAAPRGFRADYRALCIRGGGDAAVCHLTARCTSNALTREGLLRENGQGFTPAEQARARFLAQECRQAAEGDR